MDRCPFFLLFLLCALNPVPSQLELRHQPLPFPFISCLLLDPVSQQFYWVQLNVCVFPDRFMLLLNYFISINSQEWLKEKGKVNHFSGCLATVAMFSSVTLFQKHFPPVPSTQRLPLVSTRLSVYPLSVPVWVFAVSLVLLSLPHSPPLSSVL